MTITIYHNPRCSKSRQTLQILQDRGHTPVIIEYLETPPDASTLAGLVEKLDLAPSDIIRTAESVYKDAGAQIKNKTGPELLAWLALNPQAIQRPIVVVGDRACIGRPPESVLDILP
jgi:arsenate reductase